MPPVVRMASFAPDSEDYGLVDAAEVSPDDVSAENVFGPSVEDYERASENIRMAKAVLSMPGSEDEQTQDAGVLEPRDEVIDIGAGQTVAGVLQKAGVSGPDAYNAVKALSTYFDPREVKAGQAIEIHLEPTDDGLEFAALNMKIDPIKEVVVSKKGDDNFTSKLKEKKVVLQTNAGKAKIETSLYGSAARAGIPASVIARMIRVYSYGIDFQRDIRQGDKVEILYETYRTEDGDFAHYGDVLFANLVVGGKGHPVYRFEDKDGNADYYSPDGKSVRKSLMRTPVDGARVSSGFGMRFHPVLGYNKMHKGMDFAAPLGTPIYAAGDGTVEIAGRRGAYGNYVRIRHNGSLKTAYGHMHKFAKGIKPGVRVKQGEVIGYIGATGRATGPHLHYEVLRGDTQVNPKSITEQSGKQLAGADLDRFKEAVSALNQQYASMTQGVKFAQADVAAQQ
ncbi:MAG: peptidoglycan DD-metalloendopeptidase family protein [Alphaproteobacteria bacterium]|nr:peptidoglycan DD-metalloendopeptidase family protein [Alphaproteobacteria bacterium]